jgi:hypothetical protein
MHVPTTSTVAIAILALVAAAADGAQNGRGGGSAPHAPNVHAAAARTTPPTTHGNPHASTRPTQRPTAPKATPPRATPHKTTPSKTTTSTLNPIAQKLQGKPLGDRIQTMLPAGMTLDAASAGFKNQGQFISAVHVSRNLGIPFADLKATMLGTTTTGGATTGGMSLGQAIQRLRPTADATTAVRLAEREADADVRTTTTTKKPTSKKSSTR